jgi:hypothetical protein
MGVINPLCNRLRIKIKPGEVPGVGGIPEPQVNAIGSVINRRFQGRQAARGANQFHLRVIGRG